MFEVFTYYHYYFFHTFTEISKSGCDLKITTLSQFDLKIAIRLFAVFLATATATATATQDPAQIIFYSNKCKLAKITKPPLSNHFTPSPHLLLEERTNQ